jgi:hypothetical protein
MSLVDDLYKALRAEGRVAYLNSNNTEMSCRCPYCGDSSKDKSHAHLYISCDPPFKFFCQRCEASGIVGDNVLEDIGIHDDELSMGFHREIKKFKRNTTIHDSSLAYLKVRNPKFPKYDLKGRFKEKLGYMEDRLGFTLRKEDLLRYRVIGSLEDFLILNKLDHMLDDDKFSKDCWMVDKFGLGWLSRDGSHASFRFIAGDFKKRFKTINLDPYGEGSKVFTIRSELGLMAPEIEVVMTEGFFDVLSVHHNFFNGERVRNRVFCAINGKGFNLFPLMLMKMGFLNINLTLYSDNDISLDDYRFILPEWRYNRIRVIYNRHEGQKDFGVRKELILPKIFKLK